MKTNDTNTNIWLDKTATADIRKWYCKYTIPVMRINASAVYRFYKKQEGASK